MPRWSAQDKQAYRTEVMRRITAAMPLVIQEYASIRDFQKIKYTINKNDNHYKGGKGEAAVSSLSLPLFVVKFDNDSILG